MRIKTIFIYLLVFLILLLGVAVFSYIRIEKERMVVIFNNDTQERMASFNSIFDLKGKFLETYAFDYSYWDEMVEFVKSLDPTWAQENVDDSMATYNANAAWVYLHDFSLGYSANNIDSGEFEYKELPLSKDEISGLFSESRFCYYFFYTNEGLMEIRGASIHPSSDIERTTDPQGYWIVGRLWTEDYIKEFSSLIGGSMSIAPVAYDHTEHEALFDPQKGLVRFCRVLNDWEGHPLAELTVLLESPTVKYFNKTRKQLVITFVIFVAIGLIVIGIFIVHFITVPLNIMSLSLETEQIKNLDKIKGAVAEFRGVSKLIANYITQKSQLTQEIAGSKKTEEDLQKEKQFIENIINTAQIIMLILDNEGCIVAFNPYMEQLSGYRMEEVKGKDWFETFLKKEDRAVTRELFSKAIRGIQTKGNIDFIATKDGRNIEIEWYDKTLTSADGTIYGLLAIGQDISERKKIEVEARKHLRELEVFYKASIGREERIIELKKETWALKEEVERLKKMGKT